MDLASLEADAFEKVVDRISQQFATCRSVEQSANLLCHTLFEECGTPDKGRSLVLSRVFLSLPYSALPGEIHSFIKDRFQLSPSADDRFLSLMGTKGREPAWCDRHQSKGHQAIPLNRETVKSVPMLSRCFQQIGFNLDIVLKGESGISLEGIPSSFGVFHVEDALGSPYVPAQEEFVKPYGVHSVIGSGAMLPSGAISVWIGFTTQLLPADAILPLARLMPAFWRHCHSFYRKRMFFG